MAQRQPPPPVPPPRRQPSTPQPQQQHVSDDPEVQEMLASGWVVAPKKPNVAVQNNVPSIFSNRVDVSYVDLSREKVGTVYTIGPELGR
jgi:hypothetical protein